RHAAGHPPLELAPEGDRRVPHLGEVPPRLDPDVDVDAPVPGRLGEAAPAELGEVLPCDGGDLDGVGEVGPGLRVEVDAQLVRVVDVVAADRPRVEGDGAEVRRPGDGGELGGAQLVGGAAAREGDLDGLDPVRHALGRDALLVERV